ncbi:MAG TPA: hypothetical protein PLV13_02240 [Ilumatobacteraceae bacterium]|nr:hypothetical protein [Ilumatobacteraceae bacterium]
MKKFSLPLICCLALFAGCSDDSSDKAAAPTADQLEPRLLNAGDIGAGWISTTAVTAQDLGGLSSSPCPGVTIPAAVTTRLKPVTGVRLTPADGTNRAIIEAVVVGDEETLTSDLQAVMDAAESCTGTEIVSENGDKARYDSVMLPAIGDQRMATVVLGSQAPEFQLTTHGHTAIVRVGGIAVLLTQYEVMTNPDAPVIVTDTDFIGILKTAVDRISAEA